MHSLGECTPCGNYFYTNRILFLQECSSRPECVMIVYKHVPKTCFLLNACDWNSRTSGTDKIEVSYRKAWPWTLQNISNFATGYFDCTCYQFKSTAGGIQLDLIRLMQSIVVLVIRPFTHRFTHASEGFITAFKNCSIYNDFKTRKVRNTTKRVGLSNHDKEKYF